MDRFRIKTPFCGTGDLRSVSITIGFVYLVFALGGTVTGFLYIARNVVLGYEGAGYLLRVLGTTSVAWIISNIFLIYGAIQRQHTFVLPWIYWQYVFVIIALAVLISISVLIGGLRNSPTPLVVFKEVMDAMIAALCCVVPFLLTVIYSFVVVYSFSCDLKGVKGEEDTPDTSVSPSDGTSTGSSVIHTPPPLAVKTEGHI